MTSKTTQSLAKTHARAVQVRLELSRRMSLERRLELTFASSAEVIHCSRWELEHHLGIALEARPEWMRLNDGLKVDVLMIGSREYDRVTQPYRGPRTSLIDDAGECRHLEWCLAGDGIADRRWPDILGIARVRGEAPVLGDARRWAPLRGAADLLERSCSESSMMIEHVHEHRSKRCFRNAKPPFRARPS